MNAAISLMQQLKQANEVYEPVSRGEREVARGASNALSLGACSVIMKLRGSKILRLTELKTSISVGKGRDRIHQSFGKIDYTLREYIHRAVQIYRALTFSNPNTINKCSFLRQIHHHSSILDTLLSHKHTHFVSKLNRGPSNGQFGRFN
ncbi:unnamed protein product [Sphenostylis stenocarpa]|uniref:Uncharacterized protein n=1 Tax=Sphenostylis stenocarpa TaxID=92480 RepID=A0AA86W0U0_9FABA|nr:unnamed protein product [Sphenostylis stenocarpa]